MKIKKIVDERQELELLKIEHVVFWIAYWGLLVSLIVQALFMDVPFQQYLPEFVIFMICSVGTLTGSVKKGQWDYWTRPTPKTYAATAAIGAGVFGVIFGISLFVRNDNMSDHPLPLILITVALAVFMFAAIFALSAVIGGMVKKKRKELERQYGDDENE